MIDASELTDELIEELDEFLLSDQAPDDCLDISELDFEKDYIHALLGPNGSGKTTLLEILSLLKKPTTGVISYEDKPIDFNDDNLTALRRRIVMVQQNPILFTTTVYKNLEFGLKVRGLEKRVREKTIDASLDLVGMRAFKRAEAHKLSGGEGQRVAIAGLRHVWSTKSRHHAPPRPRTRPRGAADHRSRPLALAEPVPARERYHAETQAGATA